MDSAQRRKLRSEEYLKSLGVPINPGLPVVEDENQAKLREAAAVARRALVLYGLLLVADGDDRSEVVAWLKEQNLWDDASPKERRFFENNNPPQQDEVNASWRVEALWIFLWALGKIEQVGPATTQCDSQTIEEVLPPWDSCAEFINQSVLRPLSEILDQTDLIYRTDWAVVDSTLHDQPIPGAFEPGVVYERHYAFNWLIGYAEDWDDVMTDT